MVTIRDGERLQTSALNRRARCVRVGMRMCVCGVQRRVTDGTSGHTITTNLEA